MPCSILGCGNEVSAYQDARYLHVFIDIGAFSIGELDYTRIFASTTQKYWSIWYDIVTNPDYMKLTK